jgi:hypothetical protein
MISEGLSSDASRLGRKHRRPGRSISDRCLSLPGVQVVPLVQAVRLCQGRQVGRGVLVVLWVQGSRCCRDVHRRRSLQEVRVLRGIRDGQGPRGCWGWSLRVGQRGRAVHLCRRLHWTLGVPVGRQTRGVRRFLVCLVDRVVLGFRGVLGVLRGQGSLEGRVGREVG